MFESAVKKLTLWYVSALFVVCVIFSIPAYFITSNRLEHGALKQTEILQEFDKPFATAPLPTRIAMLRDQQLQRDRQQLLRTIVLANVAILLLGAYFSYHFAKRTLKPIEEAHDSQTRFTTDASHELRTPLATMQTEIEVALRGKTFSVAEAKKVLSSNLEEIARLEHLSEQLLNLARLDGGQLQKKDLSLSSVIENELKHTEKRTHIAISQDIEKGVAGQGDEHLLRQLLAILVDNAVKYAGADSPQIDVKLLKKDNQTLLTIRNQGIGIKATEIPHIFDRFYRGSSATKHDTNGHGLGLSLAKQIVEAHGGTIMATSQPGKYTTFEITLPS